MNFQAVKQNGRRALSALLYHSGAVELLSKRGEQWRILMYHRIVDPESLPFPLQPGMFVRPETFRMHARYLSRNCSVIALDELAFAVLEGKKLPQRAVAITFDDGWKDNYENAFPILKEFAAPSTIFIATSLIGTGAPFWTDVAGMFIKRLADGSMPPGLLKEFASSIRQEADALANRLSLLPGGDAVDSVIGMLEQLSPTEREKTLSMLAKDMHLPRSFLDWSEVRRMAEDGVGFAPHSHGHKPFDEMTAQDIDADLQRCIKEFESHRVTFKNVFCYPGGRCNEVSQQRLKARGFPVSLGVSRKSLLKEEPPVLARTGIHEDIANTEALFAARLWAI